LWKLGLNDRMNPPKFLDWHIRRRDWPPPRSAEFRSAEFRSVARQIQVDMTQKLLLLFEGERGNSFLNLGQCGHRDQHNITRRAHHARSPKTAGNLVVNRRMRLTSTRVPVFFSSGASEGLFPAHIHPS
jgi:hypothetical protein